jgi:hypothetical protein
MKLNMKKIIVGMFSVALLLTAGNVFAVSVWNTASNDCPTVAIANKTTETGIVDPCWPLTTVSASSGQSVNLRIYYHNTSTLTATNTRIVLNAPSGAASSHSLSGQIISDQGSISFGPVNVTTASGSTLKYGGTRWYPNQSQNYSNLPSGQTGAEVLSGGLNIGTVAPGWSTQGSVVVAFVVIGPTNPPVNTPTGTLTPANNSCTISLGQNSCQINFTWATTNPASGVSSIITRDSGSTVATGNSGTQAFTVPYNTATFRLRNNAIELDTATVTSSCTTGTYWDGAKCAETVNPTYTCSVTNFTVGGALSTTVSSGNGVDLAWTTTNCSYVNVTSVGNNLPVNSTQKVYPTTSTTYTITGYGSSGTSASRTVSVVVTPNNNLAYSCMITDFKADNELFTTTEAGEPVDLSWTTQNCYTVDITPNVGTGLTPNDSHTIYPTATTTYRLTAKGNTGSSVSRTVKVTVTPKVEQKYYCSITNFEVDDNYLTYEENTRLRWDTDNCYSVSISNIGTVATTGNQKIYPSRTTSYVLTALGSNGVRQTRSLNVTVNSNNNYQNNNNCSITNFTASQTYINSGSPVTLSWNTNDCNSVNITSLGSVSNYGSRTVYPTGTTNYLLTAYGQNGENLVRSVSVIVSSIITPIVPVVPVTPVYNSCAVTTIATNINQNSATLNGLISSSSSYTNTYFEYGSTVNLGLRTATRSYSGNTSFSETISGLSPNTIYYFRFVSDCNGSTNRGLVEVFRTTASYQTPSQVVKQVVIQGTTVTGSASPVMLKIENRYETIGKGDTIEYVVTYKNIGNSTLINPILQVITREGIIITNSSKGTYSEETRTLTVELDDLISGEEGILYVQGYVKYMPSDTAKIVTTALLVYTNTNNAQENAIAYVLNIPKGFYENSLGAAAFLNGFWGFGLIGWLLIIIIILLIILIIRRYFYRPATVPVYNNPLYNNPNGGQH